MTRRTTALLMIAFCWAMLPAGRIATAQAQPTPNQTEIRKKLIDATKALSEALQALSKAEAAKLEATTDETKAAAGKAAEQAQAKAEVQRAEVAKLNRQLLDAATAQAVVVRGGPRLAATLERENADPQDPYERFAVLTPGGPVVVQVALTISGQPFRAAREKLLDEMLAAADKDKDGQATWVEAIRSPRFTLGRIRLGNPEQETFYVQSLDKNKNRLVDRSEVRLFVAQHFQSPSFSLGPANVYATGFSGVVVVNGQMVAGGGAADVRALLDSDADGVLSTTEIATAGDRLKTRDADDNDLLYANEISGTPVDPRLVRTRLMQGQPQQPAVLLGPVATADGLFAALTQQYKGADGSVARASFSAMPALFEALDKDQSGTLVKEESLALSDLPPHVELTVDLGRDGEGLAVKSVAAELAKTAEAKESATLELPGVRLALAANLNPPPAINYGQQGGAYVMRFDKDSNGYLEKSELPEAIAQQFEMWDVNEDGKVYAEEIGESMQRQLAPQGTQVVANVATQGNSLFQSLDQTGDGRLSLREMRAAHEQIQALDKDEDGQITQREIPATFSVTFGFGNAGNQYRAVAVGGMPGAATPATPANGPEWFIRMDRNGDGDVTLKEFLGDEMEFKQLDANTDGFIEAKEAAAVK